MVRLSKLADYAFVLLAEFAREPAVLRTAPELAGGTRLPLPTVSKVLKQLARGGVLKSIRGKSGGYLLGRAPRAVSVAEVVAVMEGPLAVTECCMRRHARTRPGCEIEPSCTVKVHWKQINDVVHDALEGISLADLAAPGGGRRGARIGSLIVLGARARG